MRATCVAVAVLLAACEPPVEPIAGGANRILVHGVLDLGATEQFVTLERTQPGLSGNVAIRGATVILTTGEQEFTALELNPGSLSAIGSAPGGEPAVYRFSISRLTPGVVPGASFRLRIVTLQGDSITGSTTLPSAQPAFAPSFVPTFDRDRDTLRLQWPRVAGAKGYQVGIYRPSQAGVISWHKEYAVFADTAVAIPGNAEDIENGNEAFPRNRRITVVVAAVDENFHAYYRATSGPFTGAVPSRLSGGAIGVFGSMVPVLVRRYDVQ